MNWEELVVFSKPRRTEVQKDVWMDKDDCESVKALLRYEWPRLEVPIPGEFLDVRASKVIEGLYDEVSPFPDMDRVRMASRILRGSKVFQWSQLSLGKAFPEFRPYSAERGSDGVRVRYIDPHMPLLTTLVPYCRRICGVSSGYQCAAYGSYCQIELHSAGLLPLWQDMCSAESAQTCPIRLAHTKGLSPWPQPTPSDPTISAFQEWCKTRKGYKEAEA